MGLAGNGGGPALGWLAKPQTYCLYAFPFQEDNKEQLYECCAFDPQGSYPQHGLQAQLHKGVS